ncbi:MAG TPA: CBS domain-containing protein [Solirubrobacterales bacterium]|nr:CBS domain-containing protein [Solirubrobacterales bacterium]
MRGYVRDAVSVRSPRLTADASVGEAARLLWRMGWIPVPVIDGDGSVMGVVSSNDIVRAVAQRRDPENAPVAEAAATELPVLAPDDSLSDAAATMERTGQPLALVVEDSRFIGALTVTDLSGHELVQSELGSLAEHVVTEIAPNDIMYSGSWGAYAYAGVTALQCIRELLAKLDRPDPKSILDLPCGHGRELRFLKLAYPAARVGVCDIDEDGVEFCARVFGADPTVSHEDPGKVSFDEPFELAWSGSLFTHLSADRWQGFLDLFARALEPGGLVLFTTNAFLPASILRNLGLGAAQADQLLTDFKRSRFGYVDAGEGSWGLSLARPRWVIEQVERSPLDLVSYEQQAWKPPSPPQDVVVCQLPA